MSFLNIPNYSWQSPVDSAANLPTGGAAGDARVVLDTYQAYVYTGTAWIALLSATGANAFTIVQPDSGTSPTADNSNDVLTMTTNLQGFASFVGNSTTDTISLNFSFFPENVANKATNLTSPDNTKYPTTQAVSTAISNIIHANLLQLGNNDHPQYTVKTETFILTNTDITNKFIELSSNPLIPDSVTFFPEGGLPQINGIDFIVVGNILDWSGSDLGDLLESNDTVVIQYQ